MPDRILSEWEAGGNRYRLRINSQGKAVVDRFLGRELWRRMPYCQALVDRLAELTCGRQWRGVAFPTGSGEF